MSTAVDVSSLCAHGAESLERTPPVPTLLKGPHPLHTFLGYEPQKHVIALSLRDPHDDQEMPANTKEYVTCRCVRGVRRVRATIPTTQLIPNIRFSS